MIAARVDDGKTFSNLIKFGRVTHQKRRVGMLLTLGSANRDYRGNVNIRLKGQKVSRSAQLLLITHFGHIEN